MRVDYVDVGRDPPRLRVRNGALEVGGGPGVVYPSEFFICHTDRRGVLGILGEIIDGLVEGAAAVHVVVTHRGSYADRIAANGPQQYIWRTSVTSVSGTGIVACHAPWPGCPGLRWLRPLGSETLLGMRIETDPSLPPGVARMGYPDGRDPT